MNKKENIKWIFFSLPKHAKKLTTANTIKVKIKLIGVLIYSFLNLNIIIFYQLISLFIKKKKIKKYIILGSQAPHHHENIYRFLKFDPEDATLINTYDKKSITSIEYIGLISLYKELINNFIDAKEFLENHNDSYEPIDLIYRIKTSLASYSYFNLLFKQIKIKHRSINVYSGGAELASLSAIKNSLKTNYLSHGLLGLKATADGSLSDFVEVKISDDNFPDYSIIYVYSDFEKNYLTSKLKKSKIISYPFQSLQELNKLVILFFEITDEFFDEKKFSEIVEFFKKHNFEVFGKEHPANSNKFPEKFCIENNITLIKGSKTAYEILNERHPMFALGWPSTSLCESLNLGVIPICIPDDHPFFKFKNFYPFQSKALSWNKDTQKIENLISRKSEYNLCLEKLRSS